MSFTKIKSQAIISPMKNAFSLLELVLTCAILSGIVMLALPRADNSLNFATHSLLSQIQLTRYLALYDSVVFANLQSTQSLKALFPSIDENQLIQNPQKHMWQIQFHLSGTYTQNSYSVYKDTPRFSPTTHYDGRPMSADLIAINPIDNQCLSGYNNTNVSDYCKNNTSIHTRLKEKYGIQTILLEGDSFCLEKGGGRIYFDDFGVPYCGKNPQKLLKPFKITLIKNKYQKSICILPTTGYVFLNSTCENL